MKNCYNTTCSCGCSSSGRAPPCQGGGSEFEPRHPLHKKEVTIRWLLFLFSKDKRLEPSICKPPVEVCSPPARWRRHHNFHFPLDMKMQTSLLTHVQPNKTAIQAQKALSPSARVPFLYVSSGVLGSVGSTGSVDSGCCTGSVDSIPSVTDCVGSSQLG